MNPIRHIRRLAAVAAGLALAVRCRTATAAA